MYKPESVNFFISELKKIDKASVPCLIKDSQVKTVYFGWILVLRITQSALIKIKQGT